jgi:hypothetical protein
VKYKIIPKNEIDKIVSAAFPVGMVDKDLFTLTYSMGFEKFGSYENWAAGWTVYGVGEYKNVVYSHSRIDSAIEGWIKLYKKSLVKANV